MSDINCETDCVPTKEDRIRIGLLYEIYDKMEDMIQQEEWTASFTDGLCTAQAEVAIMLESHLAQYELPWGWRPE